MDDPTVRGYVDGFKGAYVGGWAVSSADLPCEVVVTDEAANVLAKGLASIERLDLASVGAGRCDFAFSIPVPTLDRIERIHIIADGVELQRSPQQVGSGIFDGQVSVVRGAVEGWATERVSRAEPPQITILDQDGNVVLLCTSSFDETSADRHFSPARFSADLPDGCFGRGEMRLTALANGVQFAQTSCSLPVKGFLDAFSPERVTGWLLAPAALQRALAFEVWRNGERVCEVACDIVRPDLQTAYPGSRRGGFDVKMPALPKDALALTTLSFRFAGSDRDLFEGPYVLGDRAALVTSARRAAGLALGTSPADLSASERAVLQIALGDFIVRGRSAPTHVMKRHSALPLAAKRPGLSVVIPIYRGVEITKACVDSLLDFKSPDDRVILINDRSPEAAMAPMLQAYTGRDDVVLLTNESNLGFVGSVNRGLSFVHFGDVLLLNSDTRVFAGGLAELVRVAHSSPDIGTVTAMSNNATIFSYPNAELRGDMLGDVSWEELAAIALARNSGRVIDVPTGHGFCMLVRREVLDRVEQLDTIFGRGYGEENDMCARAADLGYRNVAAAGVLVEHRESTSFTGEKTALLANNLAILERRYPEYGAIIEQVERRDELRGARWALDAERLQMASASGLRFALIVCNSLGGGTGQAIADLEASVGYGACSPLLLRSRGEGAFELTGQSPILHAVFAADEVGHLVDLLSSADIALVLVHQVLGFPLAFLTGMRAWIAEQHSVFYGHDFYPICPRVTMIDAVDRFCNVAERHVCVRCVAVGGAHPTSELTALPVEEHRSVFADFLAAFRHVITPSENAAAYYRAVFPGIAVEAIPHPTAALVPVERTRSVNRNEIVLFGAIGPHKGSAKLLEIALLARLTYPDMHFTVVGYTNIDSDLRKAGNVTVTGPYNPGELPALAAATRGRLALFLSCWPETYSYTLSEAVRLGFLPLVPDIGAPADRVRQAGFGDVFAFPIVAADVLEVLGHWAQTATHDIAPADAIRLFDDTAGSVLRTREIYDRESAAKDRKRPRKPAGKKLAALASAVPAN